MFEIIKCPKSHTTHYIVDYIVSSPFCSAVRMYSDDYYTLYTPLNVSQNAFWKVVHNRWSLTLALHTTMETMECRRDLC